MIVGVQPLAGFDKLLHYKVPETLLASVRSGSLVRVPIVNRLHLGLVMEVNAVPDCPPEKLKLVSAVLHDFPALKIQAGGGNEKRRAVPRGVGTH